MIEYVERCAKLLWTPAGRRVKEWLNDRGYADEVLALNKVGADPGRRYLPRPRGFPGGWPAAVYPALDRAGAITYFQARYLDPPDGRGKYDNPSRRWATNPRLGWVCPAGAAAQLHLVVCEGIADAIAVASAGSVAVGVLGAGLPGQRLATEILDGTSRQIVVCFDADRAGDAAAQRLLAELRHSGGVRPQAVRLPAGHDATSWIRGQPDALTNDAHPWLRPVARALGPARRLRSSSNSGFRPVEPPPGWPIESPSV